MSPPERLTIDVSVARDYLDESREGHTEAATLFELARKGQIELATAPQGYRLDVRGDLAKQLRYCVVFRDWQGKQRKRSARTLAEARKLKASLTTDVDRGEFIDSRITFAEYAPEWIDRYRGRTKRGIKPETLTDYRKRLERDAFPYFARRRLSHIRPRDIKEYAALLEKQGASVGTVRIKLAPVKALLADALEEDLIRSNPAAGVRITAAASPAHDDEEEQAKSLTADELRALLDATPEAWRLFFEFLADSGLRIGEAIALQWRDVDPDARLVHVRRRLYRGRLDTPKSRYGKRRARISEHVADRLRTLRAAKPDEALAFPNTAGGYLDSGNVMSRVLKPAAVKPGLGQWVVAHGRRHAESWVGFHTLRHTCGSELFRQGWNAKQVQLQLGHHSPAFTMSVYIHVLPDDLPDHPGFGGNEAATRPTETGREDTPNGTSEPLELPGVPRLAEVAGARS
jgi:integrase